MAHVGISLADSLGKVAFVWLFVSYVLQSVGELLISPVGYAMIGKLAPREYQGIMMGSWMLVTGLASLFAGDFSGMIPEPADSIAVTTNPAYSSLFAQLGLGSTAVGILRVSADSLPAQADQGQGDAGRRGARGGSSGPVAARKRSLCRSASSPRRA